MENKSIPNSKIINDVLIRYKPVSTIAIGHIQAYMGECVLTKEEFLECFNEWVVKPSQENPVSIQNEFYIPADNGGVTPV